MFQCLYTFDEPHPEYLNSLSISPDGILLVGCFHNLVKVWDLTTGKLSHSFELIGDRYGHSHTLVNPNWKTIISDDRYGNLRTYDLWTGAQILAFPGNSDALAFSIDGKILFKATSKPPYDNNGITKINIIESSRGELLHTLLFANKYLPIRSLLISPDGNILVVQASHLFIQVWDWQTRQILNTFNTSHPFCRHWLDAVATRPNGQIIAAVAQMNQPSEKTTVAIWDLQSAEVLYTLGVSQREPIEGKPHSTMTPDGSLLAVANNNQIEIWDLESRKKICILCGHQSRIDYLTISQDGKTIISYAFNDSIKVYQ